MSKGFTLIELALTVIVLGILSAFTFSVVWQYSNIYMSTRGGYIYSEAAAVLERITRELKDAEAVDWNVTGGIVHRLPHVPAYPRNAWRHRHAGQSASLGAVLHRCGCDAGVGYYRAKLWRVEFNNNTPPYGDQCASGDPVVGGVISSVALMSGNVMSMHAQWPRTPPWVSRLWLTGPAQASATITRSSSR